MSRSSLIVTLTPDQLRALCEIVDNVDIKGKQAAFVVSVQQALAEAQPQDVEAETPESDACRTSS